MIETILSLPIALAATAFVVELARLVAILLVLETGLVDTAETLALRWIALERDGLVHMSAPGNASDLDPALHRALTESLLSHVGRFPGFAPLGRPSTAAARGRLYLDLRESGELRLEARVCVPMSFLGWASVRAPGKDRREGGAVRDCQGQFVTFEGVPSLALWAETSVPLPLSYHVHEKGLAFPATIPLANAPAAGGTVFSRGLERPRWDSLFAHAASLYASRSTENSASRAGSTGTERGVGERSRRHHAGLK